MIDMKGMLHRLFKEQSIPLKNVNKLRKLGKVVSGNGTVDYEIELAGRDGLVEVYNYSLVGTYDKQALEDVGEGYFVLNDVEERQFGGARTSSIKNYYKGSGGFDYSMEYEKPLNSLEFFYEMVYGRAGEMFLKPPYSKYLEAEGGEQYDYYTIERDYDEGYMNARVPTLKTNRLFEPLYYNQYNMMRDMSDRISTAFHPNAEVREQSGYGTREKQSDAIFNGLKRWNEQMIEDLNGVKRSIDMELGDRKFEAEESINPKDYIQVWILNEWGNSESPIYLNTYDLRFGEKGSTYFKALREVLDKGVKRGDYEGYTIRKLIPSPATHDWADWLSYDRAYNDSYFYDVSIYGEKFLRGDADFPFVENKYKIEEGDKFFNVVSERFEKPQKKTTEPMDGLGSLFGGEDEEAPKSKPTKSSNDFIEVGKIATITRRNDSYTGKILHIWETKQFTYMNVAFPLRSRDIEMNEEEIKNNNPYLYNFPIWLVNSNDRPKQTHWGMTLRQRHGEDGWERVSSVKHSYERTDFSIRKGQFRRSLGGSYFTCNLKTKPFNSEGFEAETFEAKGIDTFTEPFDELKSGSILNKAILLGSLGAGAMIGLKLRK